MKNMKKSLLLLTAVVVLLMVTVGGTVAYLVTSTGSVTNTFTPASVDTEIEEEFDGSKKSSIIITNKNQNAIPVYVRVALIGNWVDADGDVVEPWTGTIAYNSSDWCKGDDGYYYYTKQVPSRGETTNLLADPITANANDGLHLEVTVIQQSIQAEPPSVVEGAWGVEVADDGTISK